MPGAASGSGGGVATLGYNASVRLTPLTVGFHETQFIGVVGAENRELWEFGPPALWSSQTRQDHAVPMGPVNPQALNRYAYCLDNPLRYVDPSGHYLVNLIDVDLTADEVATLIREIEWWVGFHERWIEDPGKLVQAISMVFGAAQGLGLFEQVLSPADAILLAEITALVNPSVGIPASVALFCGALTADFTKNDLDALLHALLEASEGGTKGVHLTMGSNGFSWGIKVNGERVVGHLNFGHPLMTPKGTLNLTQSFMMIWSWYYGW